MARNAVRFVRRGRVVERRDFTPVETLLDHLRLHERAYGTKEGCAEGDCGACTVAVGRPDGHGGVTWRPVNSCILLLGMVDGAAVVAVEDLASADGALHPVQRAMVDLHGSQCGFCTPGFVMSLFTLYHSGLRPDRTVVNDWLAGNLCRCTGYRPIADAALACCTGEATDAFAKHAAETAGLLAGLSRGASPSEGADPSGDGHRPGGPTRSNTPAPASRFKPSGHDDLPGGPARRGDARAPGHTEPPGETGRFRPTGPSDDADLFVGDDASFFAAPASEDALAALCARYPDATLVGGATDVGLWITKQLRDLPRIVHTGRVAALHEVREADDRVEIGAAATYAEAEAALGAIDPDVGEMLRRLGSKQVRATGTVGGNIANGSPIGDSPPVLIALGATIELRHGDAHRMLALEDFFLDYGRQDRAPGEILTRITVPRLGTDAHFRCYKISKRFDQDISALLGAFRFRVHRGRIAGARIAFGGMAATPKRAAATERAVTDLRLRDPASWPGAADALAQDFSPIDDHRASARYRMRVARSLLLKALAEIAGRPTSETRIIGVRERQDDGRHSGRTISPGGARTPAPGAAEPSR